METELLQLIDRYGIQLGLVIWFLYRDHRFLRKLEAVLDLLARPAGTGKGVA